MKRNIIKGAAASVVIVTIALWALRHFSTLKYTRVVTEDQVNAIAAIADYLRDAAISSEENLNTAPQSIVIWQGASISKEPFLQFLPHTGIIDKYGNKLSVYRFKKDEYANISNANIRSIQRRYQVAVWSSGSNGVNEFGKGDDIFSGFTLDNRWEPDPTAFTAFLRSRLTSRKEFK